MTADARDLRLGVFGGTFDPPHLGHLVAVQDVCESLHLDRVLFVVAARSPHKQGRDVTPAPLRIRMVESAVEGDPRFVVSDLEVRRGGVSYTVDTLKELSATDSHGRPLLILGADQWVGFDRWRRPEEIMRLADLVLMTRLGDRPTEMSPDFRGEISAGLTEVSVTRMDVSSSLIRKRVRERRSIRYLVPESVRRIIEAEKLYLLDSRHG